jgi:hypothetical protein
VEIDFRILAIGRHWRHSSVSKLPNYRGGFRNIIRPIHNRAGVRICAFTKERFAIFLKL